MFFDDGSPRWFAGGGGRMRGRQMRRHRGGGGGNDWGGFGGDRRGAWRDMMGEPAPRVERGGVRYLVLDAIADTPRHGYEIMATIAERSRGAYRPSPGVTYPTLQLLEELGHVRVTERDGKKVYAITATGTADLHEHRDEVDAFYERSDDQRDDDVDLHELLQRVRRLVRAFRRAGRRGRLSASIAQQVRATLDGTIARLEALLDD
jgi:DNA-binding PadR family transcriptional regulator